MQDLMIRLLASSVAVARRAGQHIRDVLQSGKLAVVEKGVNDPQTEADRRSQRCILASLKSQYPNVTVIGEEDLPPSADDQRLITHAKDESVLSVECPKMYKGIEEKDISIWVDPLDGTSEFTAGFLDRVTVLIGIAIGSEPIAGVIYQPFYEKTPGDTLPGRMIWGMMGVGIRGDFAPAESPPKRQIVASTRTHGSGLVGEAIDAIRPDEVLRVGGCGYKCLLVLERKASAYVFAHRGGTKKWDTCAPDALLHSVGGHMTDVGGDRLTYHCDVEHFNNRGILVTMNNLDWYVEKLAPIACKLD